MAIYPRGSVFWTSFNYRGIHYQESTRERLRKKPLRMRRIVARGRGDRGAAGESRATWLCS